MSYHKETNWGKNEGEILLNGRKRYFICVCMIYIIVWNIMNLILNRSDFKKISAFVQQEVALLPFWRWWRLLTFFHECHWKKKKYIKFYSNLSREWYWFWISFKKTGNKMKTKLNTKNQKSSLKCHCTREKHELIS